MPTDTCQGQALGSELSKREGRGRRMSAPADPTAQLRALDAGCSLESPEERLEVPNARVPL